jgi:hypothetical protein
MSAAEVGISASTVKSRMSAIDEQASTVLLTRRPGELRCSHPSASTAPSSEVMSDESADVLYR